MAVPVVALMVMVVVDYFLFHQNLNQNFHFQMTLILRSHYFRKMMFQYFHCFKILHYFIGFVIFKQFEQGIDIHLYKVWGDHHIKYKFHYLQINHNFRLGCLIWCIYSRLPYIQGNKKSKGHRRVLFVRILQIDQHRYY